MAGLRRIGLTHPLDSKPLTIAAGDGYPARVLEPLAPRTDKRVREFLHSKGWPLEVTVPLLRSVVAGNTAEKAFYHLGYRLHPEGKKRGQANIWVANAEITKWHEELLKSHPVNSTPDVEVKLREGLSTERFDAGPKPDLGLKLRETMARRIRAAQPEFEIEAASEPEDPGLKEEPAEEPEADQEPEVEHVDFIDERDSWVVPMDELFTDYTRKLMEDQLRVLRTLGMDYELRVWRKKEEQ